MHNPQGIEALKDLVDLTAEQDEKKNTILKNVAISSLINPNLHDKAKQIFDKFDLAGRGVIRSSDLRVVFNPANHPGVASG